MTVLDGTACPQCGRPRPSDAASGLCAACLFAIAASIEDEVCPYQVLAPIEQDAHGVTYLAERHASSSRGFVALSVIAHGDGDAILGRFHQLRPALARLQHPGAAKVLDAGSTSNGSVYVVSEYVTGTPLAGVVTRQRLDRAGLVEIARQMTEAVAAAHSAGVLHLALDGSRVKVSTAGAPHAAIAGFGVRAIVEGCVGDPDTDLRALDALVRQLELRT
jgi:serine/threonine protein kinase